MKNLIFIKHTLSEFWVELHKPVGAQLVLNIALPAVQEYLYTKVSHMLANYAIEYIKWGHNRVLPFADVAQTQAIYCLLSRLRTAFPHVEIESCSSGGAHIDYGVLEHTQRV